MSKIVIAIDGFSSCGKSTMAKDLAKKIGYIYIDSGAMYRAITLFCLQKNFFKNEKLDIVALKSNIEKINITFKLDDHNKQPITYLNNQNVENQIREMSVSSKVSEVSAIGFVRHTMVALQQKMGKEKGIVMDGRDIGTVVFPEAEMKVFVTAQPQIRANRRLSELRRKGDEATTFDQVFENLQERDNMDQTREESPLKQAEDAFVLDNSYMTIDQQMQWLLEHFNNINKT